MEVAELDDLPLDGGRDVALEEDRARFGWGVVWCTGRNVGRQGHGGAVHARGKGPRRDKDKLGLGIEIEQRDGELQADCPTGVDIAICATTCAHCSSMKTNPGGNTPEKTPPPGGGDRTRSKALAANDAD